ncbi:MAG: zinc-binding dehydrogenase [Chloroflexi bacterium]|nr:zinc-binding dehydrogenase [Chloroflexota bacterium]
MKAVVIHEYGDENVMHYQDFPTPTPGPRDVLIQIKAACASRSDTARRSGTYGGATGNRPLPFINGLDVAGVVVDRGPGVTEREVGDRVVALLANGGYAEYVACHVASTASIPPNIGFEQACTIPVIWMTAWFGLLYEGELKAGETALVNAAGSGIGSAGIQIAKAHGARVITTAGADWKLQRAKAELGADETVNYTTQDTVAEVLRLTGGRGVDVALDAVGGQVYLDSIRCLAEGGRLVSVGAASGGRPSDDPATLTDKHVTTKQFGLPTAIQKGLVRPELQKCMDMLGQGRFKAVIHQVLPLSQVREAHRIIASRDIFGRVVLVP